MFYLRLVGIMFLRFLLLSILVLFVQNFEVSPLPNWTLIVFAYLVQYGITYGCARFVLRHHIQTTWWEVVAMCVAFIMVSTMMETSLYLFIIRGDARDVLANYSWRSLPLVFLHLLAILSAVWMHRRQKINIPSM